HALQVERLDQVLIESAVQSPAAVFGLAIAGQRHHEQLAARRSRADAGRDFVAFQVGQTDVHDGDVGSLLQYGFQSFSAVLGRLDVVPQELQQVLHHGPGVGVVLDQDDRSEEHTSELQSRENL